MWISGPLVSLPEIASWATACERMQRSLAGEAQLDCLEPGLNVKLTAESLGHISMTVEITPDHLNQEHTFRFEIDQSYLTSLISTLRSILREFPIKGVSDG